jgi:hypothetical protein
MNTGHRAKFFNRLHFMQGMKVLALVFCMMGIIFAGLDEFRLDSVRTPTFWWISVGIGLSLLVGLLSRRVMSGIAPLLTGSGLGFLYLAIIWLMAKR